jgi:hypothetical protein
MEAPAVLFLGRDLLSGLVSFTGDTERSELQVVQELLGDLPFAATLDVAVPDYARGRNGRIRFVWALVKRDIGSRVRRLSDIAPGERRTPAEAGAAGPVSTRPP